MLYLSSGAVLVVMGVAAAVLMLSEEELTAAQYWQTASFVLFVCEALAWGAFLLSLPLGGHPPLSFLLVFPALFASFVVAPVGLGVAVVGRVICGNEDRTAHRTWRWNILGNAAMCVAGGIALLVIRWVETHR